MYENITLQSLMKNIIIIKNKTKLKNGKLYFNKTNF